MPRLVQGWELSVDRGPDWVFVRLMPPGDAAADSATLAEQLWELLGCHMAHRLVLEMQGVELLHSELIGQLVLLHKRIHAGGGIMRLCGLSERNQEVLRFARLDDRFPRYPAREDAVLGHRPLQPR